MRAILLTAALAALAGPTFAASPVTPPPTPPITPATAAETDPFVWLEDAESPRALAWVKTQNDRTLAELRGDPRYAALRKDAKAIFDAADRIPAPSLIGRDVHNLWQDPEHVRGLWRRTSLSSYATPAPAWETVLDLDALSAADKADWVWRGVICPAPAYRRCMLQLSDGGEDAVRAREFDLRSKTFVKGGFDLPRGKQTIDWLDDDTLIVSRDWGPGTTTPSGYGFVVKVMKRGWRLDQAVQVFRGDPTDVSVDPSVLRDRLGNRLVMIERATDFFHAEHWMLTDHGPVRLNLPQKSTVEGLLDGRLILTLQEDWSSRLGDFKAGSLVAVELRGLSGHGGPTAGDLERATLLYEPGAKQSIEQVAVTAGSVIVAAYDNVRARVYRFTEKGFGRWTRTDIPVAEDSSASVAAADQTVDDVLLDVENFVTPSRVYWVRDTAAPVLAKASPARFDASDEVVEQYEAASSDGTLIPYFVVHRRDMPLNSANPTLLYAYGGFQASMLPSYSPTVGKLWLERGGVYVLANIRGGGEFGPAWHEAGLKTHRQRVFDDFAAVGRDLIARKITSPRRLGIEGGSNGGLLMGVELTQHPELWNAALIEVPLLDMVRFEQIGAGASWSGEYGSMANPDEAAFLRRISPYQNLKAGTAYPEPFFVTSTKDDRVTPAHARKMAARMQAMGLPFLYFENDDGGHAASANLQERADRAALEFTYLIRKLMD
jgi:prolyl oligopeptidase